MAQEDVLKDKASEIAKKIDESTVVSSGEDKNVLRYPLDLTSNDQINQVMRFNIKTRENLKENKKTIYLYTPPGIALADSASYNTQDAGFIGGALASGATAMKAVVGEGGGFWAQAQAAVENLGGWKEIGGGAVVAGSNVINTKIGDVMTMGAGKAANPHTNIQFSGVGMRSFTFTYKLVAQDKDEALEIRSIENTFRKFLYPSTETGGMILRYPPYWQIQFMKFPAASSSSSDEEEEDPPEMKENRFLPYIDLCYLRNISVTYNSSSNAFHLDGVPIELDMSLSFDEAQQNTRGDIYGKGENKNFDSSEYTFARGALPDVLGSLSGEDEG